MFCSICSVSISNQQFSSFFYLKIVREQIRLERADSGLCKCNKRNKHDCMGTTPPIFLGVRKSKHPMPKKTSTVTNNCAWLQPRTNNSPNEPKPSKHILNIIQLEEVFNNNTTTNKREERERVQKQFAVSLFGSLKYYIVVN